MTAVLACTWACPVPAQQDPAAILYATQSRLDSVAAYRVRGDGRPETAPFFEIDLGSGSNPRRLELHPDGCALYVATANRLEVLRILSDGRLERFDDDADTMRRMRFVKPANFQYIALHPSARALYTSLTAVDQIQQYFLNDDGSLQRLPEDPEKDPPIVSCVQSVQNMRHQGLGVTGTHLYASAHAPARIDIFSLDASDRVQSQIERPDGNDDTEEPAPEVFTTCDPERPTFAEAFSGGLLDPKALILNAARDTVYVADLFRLRIYACPIAPDGTLPDCPQGKEGSPDDCPSRVLKTKQGSFYEQLALSDAGVLFASVFREGRLRAFTPDCEDKKGRLKRHKRHPFDLFTSPGGLEVGGDLLYVAQGDSDRIAVFPIDESGFVLTAPKWQTEKIEQSFPNDVELLSLPVDPSGCAVPTTSATSSTTTSTTSSPEITTTTTTTTTLP